MVSPINPNGPVYHFDANGEDRSHLESAEIDGSFFSGADCCRIGSTGSLHSMDGQLARGKCIHDRRMHVWESGAHATVEKMAAICDRGVFCVRFVDEFPWEGAEEIY
ncbi:unnamed protein product [Heligmosomoides polygyrus]|uniref:Uncharacterized protein n=1 Tax=Heligmosomoides polygyrus TaxID=6339 RepID=A0A183FDI1_HELPZ|nr:unnamed protein product [Heligmosomoides polygyrus]